MPIPINDKFSRRNNIEVALTSPEDVQVDFLSVPDIASRDNIASFRRRSLMVVRVKDAGSGDTKFYELQPDLTTWTEDSAFGSGSFIELSEKGAANGVVPLNANSKIDEQYLNSLFINSTTGVADIAAMIALTSVTGDVFVVEDASADPNVPSGSAVYYKINNDDPAALDDFLRLDFGAQVLSVNGKTGVVSITITELIDGDVSGFNNRVANSSFGTTTTSTLAQHTTDIATNASDIASILSSIGDQITEFDSSIGYLAGEIIYDQDGSNNKELFISILANPSTSVGPYEASGSTYWERFGSYYTQDEVDALLSSKADLTGGIVDDSQLNTNILRSSDLETVLTDDAAKVASSKGARDYAQNVADQAESNAIVYVDTNFDTSSEVDTKISNAVGQASQGITGEFTDLAERDASNTITNGERWSVLEENKVYEFTGVLGQSGSSFWDFVYTLSSARPDATYEIVTSIAHGFRLGEVVGWNTTSMDWEKSLGGNTTTAKGIVSKILSVDRFEITYNGVVDTTGMTSDGVTALQDNTRYYISETNPGELTTVDDGYPFLDTRMGEANILDFVTSGGGGGATVPEYSSTASVAGVLTLDFTDSFSKRTLVLDEDVTSVVLLGLTSGHEYSLIVSQDITGGWSLDGFPAEIDFGDLLAPVTQGNASQNEFQLFFEVVTGSLVLASYKYLY